MQSEVSKYLAKIGKKGGLKSRRELLPGKAKEMVKIREARRAYKRYHTRCFWSFNPAYSVQLSDIPWIVEQLRKNGGNQQWAVADKLCR